MYYNCRFQILRRYGNAFFPRKNSCSKIFSWEKMQSRKTWKPIIPNAWCMHKGWWKFTSCSDSFFWGKYGWDLVYGCVFYWVVVFHQGVEQLAKHQIASLIFFNQKKSVWTTAEFPPPLVHTPSIWDDGFSFFKQVRDCIFLFLHPKYVFLSPWPTLACQLHFPHSKKNSISSDSSVAEYD